MQYLLGIDFGGGASKATLLGTDGKVYASHSAEYPTAHPKPGYAEQNPASWRDALKENVAGVLAKSGARAQDIAAVCLDGATHTAVLLDADFNVLRQSIYWTDSRSANQARRLREKYDEVILKQTLHLPDTVWTLPQLLWLKENEPQLWSRVRRVTFVKDYVRHMLTGDFKTDEIEAQGSMFFDNAQRAWSKELCNIIGLSADMLPEVVRPSELAGHVTRTAAADIGLCEGTPVICGTTDTALEVFASGAVRSGNMTIKLATAGRICVVTERPYPTPHLINYSHIEQGLWYPGTATKSCASSYRWYRDAFGGSYAQMDSDAASVPLGADGLLFHPYLNGELTPYANPSLRASFTGISAGHTRAHFCRAVLEGVALSLLDCKNVIDELGISHDAEAAIIGGGAESVLWRQIVSDVLGISLVQMENSDSSFGAAMLAGISAGIFKNAEAALAACSKRLSVTLPSAENNARYAEIYGRYKKICSALAPMYRGGI